ncbi:MAG: hypothetical protein JOZ41_08240 [Chloroflexi bacterium]|nr:hypothetical protein [Chloroflexota bacterium]
MKIGLMVGRENTFPQPFLDRVNQKGGGDVTAEFVKLGGSPHTMRPEYRLIVDRISHEIPYYREYLKVCVLRGTLVVNDPFWWLADDKFFECALAEELGVAVPRTVTLPNKSYIEGVSSESLRNLIYPVDWQAIVDFVGLPAFMKPAVGGGWKNVYKVHSLEELLSAYDQTGTLPMILQESIEFEGYVRCICIGKTNIQPIRYEPSANFFERYVVDENYLGPNLRARIVHDAQLLNEALGFDMNTVEFAIRGGIPYAIDFLNPACDFDRFSIREYYFEWVLETMSDFVIARARSSDTQGKGYPWYGLTHNARAYLQTPSGAAGGS